MTGLMLVRACHHARGKPRKKILVPDSVRGDNPASAALVGYESVSAPSNTQRRANLVCATDTPWNGLSDVFNPRMAQVETRVLSGRFPVNLLPEHSPLCYAGFCI